MSGEQLIPNAVGRLDDVVEAIRDGRKNDVIALLCDREIPVLFKVEIAKDEMEKAESEFDAIHAFLMRYAKEPDFAERVRVACGGGVSARDTSPDRGLEST